MGWEGRGRGVDVILNVLDLINHNGSSALSVLSLIIAGMALYISWRTSRNDRINLNSWETYRAYNTEEVRHGRAIARQVLHDTDGRGYPTYDEYREHFYPAPGVGIADQEAAARRREAQHLHDLLAFYHQVGLLFQKGELNKDFTLLLVGPGLHERWKFVKQFASYHENDKSPEPYPYGGVYILYAAYRRWQRRRWLLLEGRFPALNGKFKKALDEIGHE
jgi:hypothetical protein